MWSAKAANDGSDWMFHFARHKWIGIQQEHIETSLRTEIYPFAAIICAWIFGCIFYLPATCGFELRLRRGICLSLIHYYFPLSPMEQAFDKPYINHHKDSQSNTQHACDKSNRVVKGCKSS